MDFDKNIQIDTGNRVDANIQIDTDIQIDTVDPPEKRRRPFDLRLALRRRFEADEVFGSLMSVLLHFAAILLLALLFFPTPPQHGGGFALVSESAALGEIGRPEESGDIELPPTAEEADNDPENPEDREILQQENERNVKQPEQQPESGENTGSTAEIEIPDYPGEFDSGDKPGENSPASAGKQGPQGARFVVGGGLEGRTAGHRGFCLEIGETTRESEAAVEAALQWFAAHQCKDGGWNFSFAVNDSNSSGCGRCTHGGDHGSRVAATSVVLLAYLGAGYSPDPMRKERYQQTIFRGLKFLVRNGRKHPTDGSVAFVEGYHGMYIQGLATLALTEAYGMAQMTLADKAARHTLTSGQKDLYADTAKDLETYAQGGILYILKAQDLRYSGGWRYRSQETPGDLSVTGWQIMALKSGKLADCYVSQPALYRAGEFLDMVQYDEGRRYYYIPKYAEHLTGHSKGPDSPKTCTAIGLLCRLYLGWVPGEPSLDGGIEHLGRWGPLRGDGSCNLYYAYYATLAMHHYGGSEWPRWFPRLREHLVATQAKEGCEAGSWHVPDYYCDTGGRLLNTALATMILEVPYRYMPLYRQR